jgi:hypothetical protein
MLKGAHGTRRSTRATNPKLEDPDHRAIRLTWRQLTAERDVTARRLSRPLAGCTVR